MTEEQFLELYKYTAIEVQPGQFYAELLVYGKTSWKAGYNKGFDDGLIVLEKREEYRSETFRKLLNL